MGATPRMVGRGARACQHIQQRTSRLFGEVAQELGLTLRALRFYETKGLVWPKRQLRSRLYSNEDIERLRLVVKLKGFALSILEIKQLLKNPGNGLYGLSEGVCAELVERGQAQKLAAEAALRELRQIAGSFRSQTDPFVGARRFLGTVITRPLRELSTIALKIRHFGPCLRNNVQQGNTGRKRVLNLSG